MECKAGWCKTSIEGPDEMRNEFLKYGGWVLTQTQQNFFKMIFDSEDIPHQWKISMLILQTKEKRINKN